MKPSDIKIGKTYINRGAGRAKRTVVDIGDHIGAPWFSDAPRPDEPVVQFEQNGRTDTLYLRSFASWAGREVEE